VGGGSVEWGIGDRGIRSVGVEALAGVERAVGDKGIGSV
jgi:hypothetical protein